MKRAVPRLLVLAIVLLAGVYLTRVDYVHKLDTDVSSLLPNDESAEVKIARQLIGEEQGRVVYLEAKGLAGETNWADDFRKQLESSRWVESVVRFDERTNLSAMRFLNERRFELLFPKWLAEKRAAFEIDGEGEFADWVAEEAVSDMDAFLESPSALELAREELLDPLLLSVGAILRLSEGGTGMLQGDEERDGRILFWAKLAESPLARDTQEGLVVDLEGLEQAFVERESEFELKYGGLVRLASASRERIQKDVFKINILSLLGVALAGGVLAGRPWRLLWAIPTVLVGMVIALSISFLVFETVNVIVLVIGSILIGTAIDYAIHLIFKEVSEVPFPTAKLVAYACFSTVCGFAVLLFADLELIRQIGVFVGAGLLGAFLAARATIYSNSVKESGQKTPIEKVKTPSSVWLALALAVFASGVWGLFGVRWVDDLRKLEAPDEALVEEDLALRERFGGTDTERSIFITTGDSYLQVMENEAGLLARVGDAGAFGLSQFLPTQEEVALADEWRSQLPELLSGLESAFAEAGYEAAAFDRFFEEAQELLGEDGLKGERVEGLLGELADRLRGPMESVLGTFDDQHWSLASASIAPSEAVLLLEGVEQSFLFSQLSFLNKALGKHRVELLNIGVWAAALVGVVMLVAFGLKRGVVVVLYPLVGGGIAVGLCSLFFGELNLFHLVGCFLGGAIALDYALFAIEAYRQGLPMPRSVWLSAGTTTASFLALGFSSVAVVQSLGWLVALLACVTLLLLHCSQPFLRRFLREDGPK
ncbi:hypothetical protein [Pelagicoccus sp. SDUM812002]|uniref:hypothetical protein n=1 Tax=Pelagicoccus sp. SDUM812002 TaxID=3041266 RepID=UPI00280E243E|nr:hypothetical protein [Pelagicoccus sp. SDUM812002]MDQ8186368.1 hypothetical protein [Pelagicoccus sp. SDUM812002]